MPNKDEVISLPFQMTHQFGLHYEGYPGIFPGTEYGLGSTETSAFVFLRETRVTTDRNKDRIVRGNLGSCKSPPVLRPKTPKAKGLFRGLPRSAQLQLREWRKQNFKNIRAADKLRSQSELLKKKAQKALSFRKILVPDGFEAKVALIDKNKSHFDLFVNPKFKSVIFRAGARTRHNKRVPVNALVNDLTYHKQTLQQFALVPFYFTDWDGPNNWREYFGSPLALPLDHFGLSELPFRTPESYSMNEAGMLEVLDEKINAMSKMSLRRLYTKIKNQKVDLFTELSQAALTGKLIADLATRLAKSILALKKGHVTTAFKTLFPKTSKELANDYLAYQYGIKPLIADIQGGAEQLAEFILKAAPLKVNGHATLKLKGENSFDETTFSVPQLGGDFSHSVEEWYDIRIKYGVEYSVDDQLLRSASQLGFTSPANTIWELVPFSFVVDWFAPIGDFLNNLTALKGLIVKTCYKTHFIRRRVTYTLFKPTAGGPISGGGHSGNDVSGTWGPYTWVLEQYWVKREVIPLPDLPKPSWKSPVSTVHATNALALIRQLIK